MSSVVEDEFVFILFIVKFAKGKIQSETCPGKKIRKGFEINLVFYSKQLVMSELGHRRGLTV